MFWHCFFPPHYQNVKLLIRCALGFSCYILWRCSNFTYTHHSRIEQLDLFVVVIQGLVVKEYQFQSCFFPSLFCFGSFSSSWKSNNQFNINQWKRVVLISLVPLSFSIYQTDLLSLQCNNLANAFTAND